ncbi:MAG TPA: hypothetical protein VF062_12435 [Candidatus Limnocylindrales bacterium]
MTPQPAGWPFLIAAGRHRDYSILLAPDFLVEDLDYGFLDGTVKPGNGRPSVVDARTRAGRQLTVVSATHTLTPADAPATHDEHGRPMRLLYGFVCGERIVEPDPVDLAAALAVALDAYRRFLDNEDSPMVMAGQPFALRSAVIRAPRAAAQPRRGSRAGVSIAGTAAAVALAVLALVLWLRPQAEAPGPCPSPTVTAGPAAVANPGRGNGTPCRAP